MDERRDAGTVSGEQSLEGNKRTKREREKNKQPKISNIAVNGIERENRNMKMNGVKNRKRINLRINK